MTNALRSQLALVIACLIPVLIFGQVSAGVPLPKVKPGSNLSGPETARETAPKTATQKVRPKPSAPAVQKPAVADTQTGPVYDNGQPMPTASPLPVTPKTKPEVPVDLSALIPWVMPSKKYTATVQEVGRPGKMLCNLTFDDGPHKKYDPLILEILAKYKAKATFYLVGRNVERLPETTKAIAAAGHEIAHHSWKHDDLKRKNKATVARDMRRTSDIIEKTVGKRPTMFRPPYGSHNDTTLAEAKKQGMETLLWSVDSLDWKKISPETVRKRVVNRAGPGAVILMHSIQKKTVTALPAIMDGLVKKGCIFVTSSQWVKAVSG